MAKQADTGVYQLKDGNWGYRFKVFVDGKAIYKKCSRDENGNLLIVHCASGANNVVITGLEGFTSVGRPLYYGE